MNPDSIGAAPGRLDFLGGVADYSGALVLQTPTRCKTRAALTRLPDPVFELYTPDEIPVRLPMAPLADSVAKGADWSDLRKCLDHCGAPRWARYPLGCLLTLARESGWWPSHGLRFDISSEVPLSMGVSSSAALEIATLRALGQLSGLRIPGTLIAHLAQRAENHIVGAPCGIMDQLASALGQPGCLLPILCRPDIVHDPVRLPEGVVAVGWPSGVRHAVADSPYTTARSAAFMGKKIMEHLLGRKLRHSTEVDAVIFRDQLRPLLPDRMLGSNFLQNYGDVDDPLSHIDLDRAYPVAAAADFAIEEHARCNRVEFLLTHATPDKRADMLKEAGQLMVESHRGYSTMGLGCPETDAMVAEICALGPDSGLYGARVSGGGSGGTVVVLLEETAVPTLTSAAERVFGKSPRFIR
jgi:L-arabinokinase